MSSVPRVLDPNPQADPVMAVILRCALVAGHIEYWSPSSFRFPDDGVVFRSKLDTDLYALAKAKAIAYSLDVSRDGSLFVVFSSDRSVLDFHRHAYCCAARLLFIVDSSHLVCVSPTLSGACNAVRYNAALRLLAKLRAVGFQNVPCGSCSGSDLAGCPGSSALWLVRIRLSAPLLASAVTGSATSLSRPRTPFAGECACSGSRPGS